MMTATRLRALCALLAILLVGALVLLFHYRNLIQRNEERPAFGPGDSAIIDRAYRLEVARGGMPIDEFREQVYPIVVSFPDKRCVQLTSPSGSIGGHSLYCFRNADGALVEQYQVGE